MGKDFTDRNWRNLLMDIEAHQVVPVVGAELLGLDKGGVRRTLYQHLASELATRLDVDTANLPEGYDLLDVTSRFLQDSANQAEDLFSEAREILTKGAWPIPEPLRKLAAIRHLDLFVSATFDSLLERALNETRFGGSARTEVLSYSEKSQLEDLSADRTSEGCTVFHLFGKMNATGDYALTEEKLLEYSHRFQSRDLRPVNLFDTLRTRSLLILGCGFPGWLGRFFLRATRGDQLFTMGARGVIADEKSRTDQNFVMFLERRRMAVYTQGNAAEFVDELHRRWTDQFGLQAPAAPATTAAPEEAPPDFREDSVFLSYASEDRPIALEVKAAFDTAGVDVWFDQRALDSGDDYRIKIEKNIENCSYFIPLLSRHTATESRRFFRLEWFKAVDEAKFRPPEFPFIQPIVIDETPLDAPGIPREFTSRHCRKLGDLTDLVEDAKKRIRARRLARRSA